MFITSEMLTERIDKIAKEVDKQSNHECVFEEFVAVPHFGQIVLRFMLNKEEYSLEDLDCYETMLSSIAGEDFLCDFMGCVYKKAGVDYSKLGNQLMRLNDKFMDEPTITSSYYDAIKEDASMLLRIAGLDPNAEVWEIQVEDGEYTLLLLGKENKSLMNISEPIKLNVGEVEEKACTGLIKGTFFCRRNHISLARVLMNKN